MTRWRGVNSSRGESIGPARASVTALHVLPRWLVVVVAACAVHVAHPDGVFGQTTYLLVTLSAAVAALVGASRQPPSRRFAWRCIAGGVALSAIGDAIYVPIAIGGGDYPDLSLSDPLWLSAYVAMALGVSSLIVGRRGNRRSDIDGLIEICSVAIVAVVVVTQVGPVRGIIGDTSHAVLARLTWSAYPILDAALIGVVAQAVVSKRLRNVNGFLLSVGITCWLVADFIALVVEDVSWIGRWLDVAWMVGAASLAVSAWPSRSEVCDAQDAEVVVETRVTNGRIATTLLSLLAPGFIEVWSNWHGHDPNPEPLFVATLLLVGLAFARSARLIKARNLQREELQRKTRFFSALAENSSDGVIVVDHQGRIINDAPNIASMLGRRVTTTIGLDAVSFFNPANPADARLALEDWQSPSDLLVERAVCALNADGSERWFAVRTTDLSDDPAVAGLVINLQDITARRAAEQELTHNAFHDSLTGLANRALFHDRLQHALERTSHTGAEVGVVYLDLDGFKEINDSHGHEAGDEVLCEVAARLSTTIRSIDTVARLGGDEFAILVEDSAVALTEAETVAQRVLEMLTTPFVVDDQKVVLSASIGITVGDWTTTSSLVLRNADLAMYKAKSTGRGKWEVYEIGMLDAALKRLHLESDLRDALEHGEFRVVYQPVMNLQTQAVAGFEALLRWDHPTLGLVEPETFIPIAEGNGTIVAIGQWVLNEACRTAAGWSRTPRAEPLTMAVNVSVRQIATPEIVDHVRAALDSSGFPAASLILELTESVLVHDAATAAQRLGALCALGVHVAIDDFGTGYSSLSYLRQFPIDVLKIDKSFTRSITDESPAPPIVRGLLDLAKTLGIATVAEGIETVVQRDSLRRQHCDYGQGFLFHRPLGIAEAGALVAAVRRTAERDVFA